MHVISLVLMLSLTTLATHAFIVKDVFVTHEQSCQSVMAVTSRRLGYYLDPFGLRECNLCA